MVSEAAGFQLTVESVEVFTSSSSLQLNPVFQPFRSSSATAAAWQPNTVPVWQPLWLLSSAPARHWIRSREKGREEGGGDTEEEGTHEEVAGKRNYGSLTPSEYTRTSFPMLPS